MSAPKKKKKKAAPQRGRKRRRHAVPRGTGVKIAMALGLLIAVMSGAGLLLYRYLPPVAPPQAVVHPVPPVPPEPSPPPPVRRKAPPPAAPPVKVAPPVYEIFPETDKVTVAKPRPSMPPELPVAGRPKVAIIIDDIGYDRALARQFMKLNVPLTFSVLPEAPFKDVLVKEIRQQGFELMLHQPMEPNEYPGVNPGPAALLAAMTADQLIAQFEQNLEGLPGVKGVNNHMGSKMTTDSARMYQVFSILKKRGLYFVDSRSTPDTICRPSARMFQVPFAERNIFLDHLQDAPFMRRQFHQLAREAQKHGQAVAIAHPHRLTVTIFKEMLPALRQKVELVPASQIVQQLD